jgi:predicted phage baseplate assembly protein
VTREGTLSGAVIQPRNPLPSSGGTAPEPTAEVRLLAPAAFRSRKERAVTAADYAELARRNPRLQGAAAELRWTGSWYEARVAVDPAHSEHASGRLLDDVADCLHRYRRMGHDLRVREAQYVPLSLTMMVCVLPHATAGGVKADMLRVLGNRRLPDGRLGFFHPDNLTFGEDVRVSKLVAAAMSVAGVDTVQVTELRRFGEPDAGAADAGVLPLGSMEIAQLDNDPGFPEHGVLTLQMEGGR